MPIVVDECFEADCTRCNNLGCGVCIIEVYEEPMQFAKDCKRCDDKGCGLCYIENK